MRSMLIVVGRDLTIKFFCDCSGDGFSVEGLGWEFSGVAWSSSGMWKLFSVTE